MSNIDDLAAAQGLERFRTVPVQPQASPLYQRLRVPETFQLIQSPEFGNMVGQVNTINQSPWRYVTRGQRYDLSDQFVNKISVGLTGYSIFDQSGNGTLDGYSQSIPVSLQCYARVGLQQEFRLFFAVKTTGERTEFELKCPVYSFFAYTDGGALPWTFINFGPNWSTNGATLSISFL